MKVENKNGLKINIGISEVHLAELEYQDFQNKRRRLEKFGEVKTVCQSVYNFEFLITNGFSEKAKNTFECLKECMDIAEDYNFVEKMITKENFFYLILTKLKK